MGLNYTELYARAKKRMDSKSLQLLILGGSGGGKSSLAGTTGVKTLYIHTSTEAHGPKAANTYGKGDIHPIMLDDGNTPDEAVALLLALLEDVAFFKTNKFEAVVIDGASELERLIRSTKKFDAACKTKNGDRNAFAEPDAVLAVFHEVFAKLRNLSEEGIHYIVTCILDIKELDSDDGSIDECSPSLSTYKVADRICQAFPDIVTVGKMTNPEGKSAHRIQFGSNMSKTSKDAQGRIKKLINFCPRLTGVAKLPDHMAASLADVIKLKEGVK